MMATAWSRRSVTFGSLDTLVREISGLYDCLFNYQPAIDTAAKKILREFEGDRSEKTVEEAERILRATNAVTSMAARDLTSQNKLRDVSEKVSELYCMIEERLKMETRYEDERRTLRELQRPVEMEERTRFEEEMAVERKNIDKEFEDRTVELGRRFRGLQI